MKTKFIFSLFVSLLLWVASINAAGLLNENDLLICPQKDAPRRVALVPAQQCQSSAVPTDVVLVKLFGTKGELLAMQRVSMQEFLSGDFTRECLPQGTSFVMYHNHTAYYQIGTIRSLNAGA